MICAKGHVLVPFITDHDGYECDVCRKLIRINIKVFACAKRAECDFDVCSNCFQSGLDRVSPRKRNRVPTTLEDSSSSSTSEDISSSSDSEESSRTEGTSNESSLAHACGGNRHCENSLVVPDNGYMVPRCPKGQKLTHFVLDQNGYVCDSCSEDGIIGGVMFRCNHKNACDYDLCQTCFAKLSLKNESDSVKSTDRLRPSGNNKCRIMNDVETAWLSKVGYRCDRNPEIVVHEILLGDPLRARVRDVVQRSICTSAALFARYAQDYIKIFENHKAYRVLGVSSQAQKGMANFIGGIAFTLLPPNCPGAGVYVAFCGTLRGSHCGESLVNQLKHWIKTHPRLRFIVLHSLNDDHTLSFWSERGFQRFDLITLRLLSKALYRDPTKLTKPAFFATYHVPAETRTTTSMIWVRRAER